MIDFPWSLWRLIGRQDRTYCIDHVYLFDAEELHWALDLAADVQCVDVQMPLRIGKGRDGFRSTGKPQLIPGVTYGVEISGIGNGRVDFELRRPGQSPFNESYPDAVLGSPCPSRTSDDCPFRRLPALQ
ncbi:hypothetical protein [Sphingomonas sp.]|uniref:hypothetical protein n=1 Tax=Sphingomonas sp. TaxID=28214 RepID=UPI00286DD0D4|nr:hypothetical protein [Sphingomonas sp.]